MAQITYENKENVNSSALPDINKINDSDMNMIKNVVNENDTNVGSLSNLNTTDKTSVINAINEVNTNQINSSTYSTNEIVIGTWIDGKTLYRKVITLSDLRTDTYIQIEVASNALIKKYEGYIQRANGARLDDLPSSVRGSKKIEYKIDSIFSNNLTGAYVIVYYTKTTD